jgi:hypothetical protein
MLEPEELSAILPLRELGWAPNGLPDNGELLRRICFARFTPAGRFLHFQAAAATAGKRDKPTSRGNGR